MKAFKALLAVLALSTIGAASYALGSHDGYSTGFTERADRFHSVYTARVDFCMKYSEFASKAYCDYQASQEAIQATLND